MSPRTTNRNTRQYKPTSADLGRATRELWVYLADERVLGELREVNGTVLQPGEVTQAEVLRFLATVVDVWVSGNYGRSGARHYLANMVTRGYVGQTPSPGPGQPCAYYLANDPDTGEPWEEEPFCTAAHEARKAAYRAVQKAEPTPVRVPDIDYSDIMQDA